MAANTALERVLNESGLSHLALARRIGEVARDWGVPTRPSHTQIARWIAGQRPRGRTPELIAEALTRRLGVRVTLGDIGFGRTEPLPTDLALAMSSSPREAAGVLNVLAGADVNDDAVLDIPVAADALAPAVLEWMVRAQPCSAPPGPTDSAEVHSVRAAANAFAGLDNRFGGGHARMAAIHYLNTNVVPLLHSAPSGPHQQALFTAAAEFVLSIAWMSYDAQRNGAARRYFLQALNLADHGGDRLLGASVLSAMSHQANYLGEHSDARNLARAALTGAGTAASHTVRAQFLMMEARATAALGLESDCMAALSAADREFGRRRPTEDPDFIAYFDEVEYVDEIAHCYRDLGRSAAARTYAQQCLTASTGEEFARSRAFSRMVLIAAVLGEGELDEACRLGSELLPRLEQNSSSRCTGYLRNLTQRLAPHARYPAASKFLRSAAPLLNRAD